MPNPQNLEKRKSFVKNDPRINKNGRPPKLPALDVLIAEVLGDEQQGHTAAKAILMRLRAKAIGGDTRAAELILDRAYGKVKQGLEHSGELTLKTITGMTIT